MIDPTHLRITIPTKDTNLVTDYEMSVSGEERLLNRSKAEQPESFSDFETEPVFPFSH